MKTKHIITFLEHEIDIAYGDEVPDTAGMLTECLNCIKIQEQVIEDLIQHINELERHIY
jgi:ornithine carbamoyltransferase